MLNYSLFSGMMSMMCEIYNRNQTKALLEGYYLILKRMNDDEFKQAMMNILEGRVYASMPKPAEILEYSRPNLETIATLALEDLERAIAKGGRNYSLIFDDKVVHSVINALGGWVYVCNMELRDWEFKKKEFPRLYMMHSKRSDHADHVAGLVEKNSGLSDSQTTPFARVAAGYKIPEVKKVAALNPPRDAVMEKITQLANDKSNS